MKKGDIACGKVVRVDFPNKGIVRVEEESGEVFVTVKNSAPGQVVRFRINKKKHGNLEGQFLEVVEHADCEIESDCPHFGICGGCLYRTFPYEEQLKMKKDEVRRLLEPVYNRCKKENDPEFDVIFEEIKGSPIYEGFRNKMEFTFGDEYKDGPLAVGLHRRNSFYDIVTVENCKIVDHDYRQILSCTKEYFAKENVPYFHRMNHTGVLRHLLVRKAKKTGEILICLVTTTQMELDLEGYVKALTALELDGTITGIVHTKNDSVADAVKDEGSTILYGRDWFNEELLGLSFKITPFSFFQTNSLGAEVLYDTVREYLGEIKGENPVVFDLYSGTGTIAQLLAPVCKKVIGIEIIEEAVEAAKENAKLNGLDNCEFLAGDVLVKIDEIEDKPDYIILDPPRDGIHVKAMPKIIQYGVDRIVYVSCKPSSLARDLECFMAHGYAVERIGTVDMFPASAHVETVVLISRVGK